MSSADTGTADRLLGESVTLYAPEGDTHAAARVSGRLAQVERWGGRFDEALARAERAFEVVAGDEPDEALADLAARLGAAEHFAGDRKSTRPNSSH